MTPQPPKNTSQNTELTAGSGTIAYKTIEDLDTAEPLPAYKFALLYKYRTDAFCFAGPAHLDQDKTAATYKAVATARCVYNQEHLPPEEDCECGFYAVFDKDYLLCEYDDTPTDPYVLLEVELSGKMELYEYGARAEHQVVTAVLLPSTCAIDGCVAHITHIQPSPQRRAIAVPVCAEHAGIDAIPIRDFATLLGVPLRHTA